MTTGAPGLTTTVPGGVEAPRIARARLAQHFDEGLDPASSDTLKLLSSEVVTNCVRHAGASAGVAIELRAWHLSGCIHVEVSTATRPFVARGTSAAPTPRGNGLRLVRELARSWGVVDNGRNTVWFKVDVDVAGAEA